MSRISTITTFVSSTILIKSDVSISYIRARALLTISNAEVFKGVIEISQTRKFRNASLLMLTFSNLVLVYSKKTVISPIKKNGSCKAKFVIIVLSFSMFPAAVQKTAPNP